MVCQHDMKLLIQGQAQMKSRCRDCEKCWALTLVQALSKLQLHGISLITVLGQVMCFESGPGSFKAAVACHVLGQILG